MSPRPSILVVTHPLNEAGENATRTLLHIINEISTTHLLTANLPQGSSIRSEQEFTELSDQDFDGAVFFQALRFIHHQLQMARLVVSRHEEIVLFFGATTYLLPTVAAKLSGKTVIVEPRGDVPRTLEIQWASRMPSILVRVLSTSLRFLETVNYHLADAIITYTPRMASELGLDRFGPKLFTNGARFVDIERFDVELPFTERENRLGFVGRLDREKGIKDLARAIPHLPDEYTFSFVGDGELRAWIEQTLASDIAEGQVEVCGWVAHDDIPARLNRFRLLVLPLSDTEGLPTIVLEALACGTPVLVSPVSGVPDVIQESVTGFFIEDPRPEALSESIVSVMDREDLATIGTNGRQLIESEYSHEAAVDRYDAILSEIGRRKEK